MFLSGSKGHSIRGYLDNIRMTFYTTMGPKHLWNGSVHTSEISRNFLSKFDSSKKGWKFEEKICEIISA